MTVPSLETPRLVLRALVPEDADALLHYRSDPETCRYVPFEPMDRREIDRRMREQWSSQDLDVPGSAVTLGVIEKASSRLIGDVVLFRDKADARLAELGYIFTPEVAGLGYATEAGRALLSYCFEVAGFARVAARLDARNTASVRVLERLGMRREAELVDAEWFKGEWTTTLIYAMLAREWVDPGC
jgi:RimJ/RimL family protein N-acetyltransferase